jgi:hypothetical protein
MFYSAYGIEQAKCPGQHRRSVLCGLAR